MQFRLLVWVAAFFWFSSQATAQPVVDLELKMTLLEETSAYGTSVAMTITNRGPDTLDGNTQLRVAHNDALRYGSLDTAFADSLDGQCDVEIYQRTYIIFGAWLAFAHFLVSPELAPNQSITCFADIGLLTNFTWLLSGEFDDPNQFNNRVTDVRLADEPSAERALLRFYQSTNGNQWLENEGWGSTQHYCSWFGVDCGFGSAIQSLELPDNNLAGELPEELLWISDLKSIDLSGNQLSGTMPKFWGLMPLEQIDLSDNQLSGTIPRWLSRKATLSAINLSSNRLTGQLPYGWSDSQALSAIDLSGNRFYGLIPDSLVQLPQLASLEVDGNFLIGKLPADMSESMTLFSASNNWLSGPLPAAWRELPNLEWLDLSSNRLVGDLPGALARTPQLAVLNIANNRLTGSVPAAYGRSDTLEALHLAHNRFTGPLPRSLEVADDLMLDTEAALLPGDVQFSISPQQALACDSNRSSVSLSWQVAGLQQVEVRRDSASGARLRRGGATGSLTTGDWVANGTVFHLVDPETGQSLADLGARVTSAGCGGKAIEVVPDIAVACAPEYRSRVRIEWNAQGRNAEAVEVRVHEPDGATLAVGGVSGFTETGFWVENQTLFYLVDAADGRILDSTRASVSILSCQ